MSVELGLRDRKKAETRRALAEVALRLFAERGFDAVTVADVAAEANVSTKTVFNYFPTKEDLVLGGGAGLDADLLHEIETRARGESILDAVRRYTVATSRKVREAPPARREAFRRVLQSTPSVQARWREGLRLHEEKLAELLAKETGAEGDDPLPFLVAGMLGLLGRLAFYDVIGWPDGKRRSAARSEQVIHEAFDQVERGLATYGVR